MSRVERFFERLVERPSARLFRTRLRPVQVLRRIERTMEAGRGVEGRQGLVPDRFDVRLHPDDLAALASPDDVAGELASGALRFARARGYELRDRPQVTLRPDGRIRAGELEVDASVSSTPASAPAADLADGGTRVYEIPALRAPEVILQVREPGRPVRRVAVPGRPIRIGRSSDCDVVVHDSKVSRRHVRLASRDGVLVLADLGSTNGTRVNGHRVTEVVLGAGDEVEIGETALVVESAPDGVGRGA